MPAVQIRTYCEESKYQRSSHNPIAKARLVATELVKTMITVDCYLGLVDATTLILDIFYHTSSEVSRSSLFIILTSVWSVV